MARNVFGLGGKKRTVDETAMMVNMKPGRVRQIASKIRKKAER